MTKINCVLIDDEPPAIILLEKYAGFIESIEVVGTGNSAIHAFEILKTAKVDLLFLDIRMPVLNGIDFLKSMQHPPSVIITTAYRDYAIDGYDLDIIDYLLKPIAFDRFLKAIDRYRNKTQHSLIDSTIQSIETVTPQKDHVFFNINKTRHKVRYADIHFLESLKDYVKVHMEGQRLVIKGNLGKIVKMLPSELFLRIHRSYAISLSYLEAYNQTTVTVAGQQLPIGASYRQEALSILES